MFEWNTLQDALISNWHVWFVTLTLIVAAVIDGIQLKVPNWITFPMIATGWIFCTYVDGASGLGWSLFATGVGLGLLLPAYAIGGMGAGDVKLMAGIGAWMGVEATFYGFCVSAVLGGVIAVGMVLIQGLWKKHHSQFWMILNEFLIVRSPEQLAEIAAERKSRMMLLPYGIPIAIGSIGYFAWDGLLI